MLCTPLLVVLDGMVSSYRYSHGCLGQCHQFSQCQAQVHQCMHCCNSDAAIMQLKRQASITGHATCNTHNTAAKHQSLATCKDFASCYACLMLRAKYRPTITVLQVKIYHLALPRPMFSMFMVPVMTVPYWCVHHSQSTKVTEGCGTTQPPYQHQSIHQCELNPMSIICIIVHAWVEGHFYVNFSVHESTTKDK